MPLAGDLKGGSGACGVFEKEVNDCTPTQGRHLLDRALVDLFEAFGEVENLRNVLGAELANSQEVPMWKVTQ